jgi:hypothetical protein
MDAPFNEFVVSATGAEDVVILRPPTGALSKDQALALAAWLVAVAGDRARFNQILDAVEST